MQIKIYVKGLPLGRSKALRPQPCPPMRGVPGGCLLVPVSAPVAHLDPFTIEVGRFYLSADWHLTPTCARPGVLERGLALNKVWTSKGCHWKSLKVTETDHNKVGTSWKNRLDKDYSSRKLVPLTDLGCCEELQILQDLGIWEFSISDCGLPKANPTRSRLSHSHGHNFSDSFHNPGQPFKISLDSPSNPLLLQRDTPISFHFWPATRLVSNSTSWCWLSGNFHLFDGNFQIGHNGATLGIWHHFPGCWWKSDQTSTWDTKGFDESFKLGTSYWVYVTRVYNCDIFA